MARPKKFDINIIASGGGHAQMGRRLSVGISTNHLEGGETKGGGGGTQLAIEVIVQEVDGSSGGGSRSPGGGSKSGGNNNKIQRSVWDEYKFLDRSFGMSFTLRNTIC